MKRKYEGLIVLNSRGSDEATDALVSKLGREMELDGLKLEQIDKIGRRKFPYGSKGQVDGYYVCYHVEAEPANLDKVRAKLKLNGDVHQQYFQRAGA